MKIVIQNHEHIVEMNKMSLYDIALINEGVDFGQIIMRTTIDRNVLTHFQDVTNLIGENCYAKECDLEVKIIGNLNEATMILNKTP